MANVKKMQDKEGNQFFPFTHTKAVVNDSGTNVETLLAAKQDKAQMATINGSRIDQGGNVTIVAAEGQTITIDATPTAGSNNAVSSGGVYNNVNGAAEQSLEFTAGQGLNANGTTYNNSNASITDYIAVNEGDSISFEGSGANNYGAVAGYNASQVFVSNIITHTGSRINETATIPSGIAYIRCSARNHTYNASTQDPEATLTAFDPYIRTSKAVSTEAQNLSDSAKEQARSNIDASGKYLKEKYAESGGNGYYRYRTGTSELYFAGTNDFRVISMIPIKVGMKIESNTTINAPYSLALNVFFGENAASPVSTPLAVAELTNGSITITQAMWDAGYRYIGISFRVADTPNPEVVVFTPLEAQVGDNKKDIISLQNDIEILKYNSTLFKVYIPSGNGKRVCYIFEKLYKKWDSLNYTDGQGQTQTLTNVVSSDYWNNGYICINDGFNAASEGYIIQGNTNMIYKLVGATYHVGNGHGCEVALFRKFFIDGKEIDIEGMEANTSVRCKTFRYIQKSECFATDGTSNSYTSTYPQIDTGGHPIVDAVHYMDCMFELGNRITINNRMQIQRDNLQFYVLYDAMLEVNYGKFTHVYVNTDDNTINQVLGYSPEQTTTVASAINLRQHPTNKASIAEMYGGDFFVRQIVIPDNASRQSKQWIDSVFYENTGRLKNYFGSVIGTHVAEALGETAEVFNAGDIIGCTAIREIELK